MARQRPHARAGDLITAATSIFLEKGYRRAQISDIARKMGVASGTIYLYAESKEALFDLVIRASVDPELVAGITLPARTRRPDEILAFIANQLSADSAIQSLNTALLSSQPTDATQELELIVRELYSKASRRWLALKLLERSAADWPELAALWFGGHRMRLIEQLIAYFRKRMNGGHLRPAPDPAAAARLVLEMIAVFAIHLRLEPPDAQIDPAVAEATVVDGVVRAYAPRRQRSTRKRSRKAGSK
jgi:AcrR family transcriptional regulator